jgi:DNA-binding MarR family transcriptional regulator
MKKCGIRNREDGFPTEEDVKSAVDLLECGRLKSKLFIKSLESIFGVSEIQLDFVELIGRKKAISPGDLAIELDVNKATISGHLEKLIENNFIQETPSIEDGRKKLLSLTDLGLKLYDIINIVASRLISRVLSFIDPETFDLMKDHVGKMMETIDARKQAIKNLLQEKPVGLAQFLMEIPTEKLLEILTQLFPFLLGEVEVKPLAREENL